VLLNYWRDFERKRLVNNNLRLFLSWWNTAKEARGRAQKI